MFIDFHYHSLITTAADFDPMLFTKSLSRVRRCGLEAICLCEHLGAPRYNDPYEWLGSVGAYDNDAYHYQDILVYAGIEVNIAPRGHIVIIGNREQIVALRSVVLGKYQNGDPILGRLIEITNEVCERKDVLVIGAHPARPGFELERLSHEELSLLDAIDLNGKDILRWEEIKSRPDYEGLPMISGSDTHYFSSCGNAFTILENLNVRRNTPGIRQIKAEVLAGNYHVRKSLWHRWMNRHSAWKKEKLVAKLSMNVPLAAL